ncbi:hypothetical protein [Ciceribacter azotifigens]
MRIEQVSQVRARFAVRGPADRTDPLPVEVPGNEGRDTSQNSEIFR